MRSYGLCGEVTLKKIPDSPLHVHAPRCCARMSNFISNMKREDVRRGEADLEALPVVKRGLFEVTHNPLTRKPTVCVREVGDVKFSFWKRKMNGERRGYWREK